MLILLEGVDGAGKSTLARRLTLDLGEFDARLLHRGPPTEHPLVEYEVPLLGYQPGLGERWVCDRWHLGEVIYPVVLGRRTQLTPEALWHIEAYLLRLGAVLVHVDAPEDVLRQRLARRGDQFIQADQLPDLRAGYDEAMLRTLVPNIAYVTDEAVLERATEQEESCRGLTPFATYVGPRYPSLLLLGERRNQKLAPWGRSPAFMPFPGTSGEYLLRCLAPELLPVDRRRLGWANAAEETDVGALYEALGEPGTVVALGAVAQAVCETTGIPHRAAPHPQWVRRFHHHEVAAYAQQVLYGKDTPWS